MKVLIQDPNYIVSKSQRKEHELDGKIWVLADSSWRLIKRFKTKKEANRAIPMIEE